jgi:uncharacterized LabA/DUF88 family protein
MPAKFEAQIIPLRIFSRDDDIVRNLKAAKAELIQIEAEEETETQVQNHSSELRDVIDRLTTIILRLQLPL